MIHPDPEQTPDKAENSLFNESPQECRRLDPDMAQPSVAAELGEVRQKQRQADQALEDYAHTKNAEFVKRMKQELGMVQSELDRLSAKVNLDISRVVARDKS